MGRHTPTPDPGLAGQFYWPRDDFSTPADNLCWHVPPSPNADFRCVRTLGHPGAHQHAWSPIIKEHSHRARLTGKPDQEKANG